MTQIDIAALVADREAGTKGQFQPLDDAVVMADDVLATVAVIDFDNTEEDQARADVRRFARLDDLETGYIAQDAELKHLRAALTLTIRADTLREAYHALPNDKNRIGDKHSRKGHARDAWLRAFRKSVKAARAALGEKP